MKGCEELKPWVKSATNHMYWCAASTPNGDKQLMADKWISLHRHMTNAHTGHGGTFPKCAHGRIRRRRDEKKWIKPRMICFTSLLKTV
jgi:hypothetical protein